MKASEVLREARKIMNNAGEHWTVGHLTEHAEDALGVMRFCAIGGLNAAAGMAQHYIDAMEYDEGASHEDRPNATLALWFGVDLDAYQARYRATMILAEAIGYEACSPYEGRELKKVRRYDEFGSLIEDVTPENAKIMDAENRIISFNDGLETLLNEKGRAAAWEIVAAKFEEAAKLAESRDD